MTAPLIRCGFGIGNRVTAIANALSRWQNGIRFVWRNNPHCPLDWQDAFPKGIPGVEFITDSPPGFSSRFDGKACERWDAAGNREAANESFGVIMRHMAGKPYTRPNIALCARLAPNPDSMVKHLIAAIPDRTIVFLFADCRRNEIATALHQKRCVVEWMRSGELAEDLARTPQDTIHYLSDWKTLLESKRIVAMDLPISALHPAMASGIPIQRTAF